MQTKLAQTTFMYSLADMLTKSRPQSGIVVSGFWTDYPIWTDALKYRQIGQKENCMSPSIISATVEQMLEDKPANIHGNVMIDHDYLKSKKIDPNRWAYGTQTQKLDDLFLRSL